MNACVCGHSESQHRLNGACMAIMEDRSVVPPGRYICRCNDYTPSSAVSTPEET